MSKRRKPKGKQINPVFWVFCEGETEKAYVEYLRSEYRLPIKIVPKVAGHDISSKYIKKSKQNHISHPKDKDFLLYDGDIKEVLEKLKKIKEAELLISNPSIELWFLFHYKNQRANITSENCIRELSNRNNNTYKKGFIDDKLKERLESCCDKACERAETTELYENPSTNLYSFIKELENVKKSK